MMADFLRRLNLLQTLNRLTLAPLLSSQSRIQSNFVQMFPITLCLIFLTMRQFSTSTTSASNEPSTFQDKYVFKSTLFLDKHDLIVLFATAVHVISITV